MNKKLLVSMLTLGFLSGCAVVGPGERGVKVSLGKIADQPLKPGMTLFIPVVTNVEKISVQQATQEIVADCFSSDLQQVELKLKVLYRIPEVSIIQVVRDFAGDPFDKLIVPRVQEATKEVTASYTASGIVKSREEIKTKALESSRKKVGEQFLILEDLVIEDVQLSKDLKAAIEAKMVQQQDAEKAIFRLQQTETDAKTEVAKARGQAESIRIQGEALEKNPKLVDLKMVEKWNGVAPVVLGNTGLMMPFPETKK